MYVFICCRVLREVGCCKFVMDQFRNICVFIVRICCRSSDVILVFIYKHTIIEPHGRGVPEAILNDRSPLAGLPECGRSPHEGRPAH